MMHTTQHGSGCSCAVQTWLLTASASVNRPLFETRHLAREVSWICLNPPLLHTLQMTTFENRTRVLAQYRIAQSMARMLGPFIGY